MQDSIPGPQDPGIMPWAEGRHSTPEPARRPLVHSLLERLIAGSAVQVFSGPAPWGPVASLRRNTEGLNEQPWGCGWAAISQEASAPKSRGESLQGSRLELLAETS